LPEVGDQDFESQVLQAELPVLVDFGAEWCHPCKQLDPLVEELASEWQGKVKVVHVDADENAQTTINWGVRGLPTLILFVDGEPKERMTGFVPKAKIMEKLAPHLSG
jgi:thioredoxin 1